MFPLHNENRSSGDIPWATWGLITVNTAVLFVLQPSGEKELALFFREYSTVPALVANAPLALGNLLDMVRSMFLHEGLWHLLGNMYFLYMFGMNVEDALGIPLFLALYFLSGLFSDLTYVVLHTASTIPVVGASGAISGVLGSSLVLFPTAKIRCLITYGYRFVIASFPGWLFMGLWLLIQITSAVMGGGGVAFAAHVGGFAFGFAATLALRRLREDAEDPGPAVDWARTEAAEEEQAVRQTGPATHDSGMRVIGLGARSKPRKR